MTNAFGINLTMLKCWIKYNNPKKNADIRKQVRTEEEISRTILKSQLEN